MQSTTENKFWKIEQLHKILFVKKKNTAHAAQRWFCQVNRRQNESGVLRGGTFFPGNHPLKVVVITVRTTTFSKIWNKRYHGSVGASRWFCKIYCGKAVVVGLICVVCPKSHIVTICFFAIYGWREGEALNLRRKALVFPLRWYRLALVDRGR